MQREITDIPNHELFRSFKEIKRSFYKVIRATANAVDVTVPQLMVLYMLTKYPAIGLGELAERLKMTTSTLSGVIDRLVKAGLVDREQSRQDRRAVILKVTNAGNDILDEAVGADSLLVKQLRGILEIPESDLQTMLRVHQQIINILNREVPEDE